MRELGYCIGDLILRQRLYIIDEFYSDPYAVRNIALQSNFALAGNYPGRRTAPIVDSWVPDTLERILGQPITQWPVERDNGAFQLTFLGHHTAVHADPGWVGLIYLTPDPPPMSGTVFYKHLATNSVDAPTDTSLRVACEADGSDPSKWQVINVVGNMFNRLVLFEGCQWHSAGEFFGDGPETGRLFQTFFFWLKDSADWL